MKITGTKNRTYAIYNSYGNNVIGYDHLHVFDCKKDRDAWVDDDAGNRKQAVESSHKLARQYRDVTWKTDRSKSMTYIYHDYNKCAFVITRENSCEHAEYFGNGGIQ